MGDDVLTVKQHEREQMSFLITKIGDESISLLGLTQAHNIDEAMNVVVDKLVEREEIDPVADIYHWELGIGDMPGVFINDKLSFGSAFQSVSCAEL